MVTGLAPRKAALTVYILSGFDEHADLLARLGPHKTGKACLYIKKVPEIDLAVLEELIAKGVAFIRETYPS